MHDSDRRSFRFERESSPYERDRVIGELSDEQRGDRRRRSWLLTQLRALEEDGVDLDGREQMILGQIRDLDIKLALREVDLTDLISGRGR